MRIYSGRNNVPSAIVSRVSHKNREIASSAKEYITFLHGPLSINYMLV